MMKSFDQLIIQEVNVAIKNFGEYNFDDKGPHEVMNLKLLTNKFEKLELQEKLSVAKALIGSNHRVLTAFSAILNNIEISDEDFSQVLKNSDFDVQEYFDGPSESCTKISVVSGGSLLDYLQDLPLKKDPIEKSKDKNSKKQQE